MRAARFGGFCGGVTSGALDTGDGPSPGGPGLLLTAVFCPCIVKSPEKPQMLAHIPVAFIVPSGLEWLCSCCKFGFCRQPVPSFQGHLSLGQRGCCVSP